MGQRLSFGDQLRRFRELAGLTQEDLAERAGVTAKAVGMLERGVRRNPYPHTVRALADQLGLSPDERASLFAALPRHPRGEEADPTEQQSRATSPAPAAAANALAGPREPHLWFPQTKLHAPLPGTDTLPRPRLLASVRAAILTHRLALIAAPAGAGKTTTLAAALREDPALAVGWLALDADDNDPATFAAALLAAVRGGLPDLGGLAQSLLDDLPNPGGQVRRLLSVLINDLPDCSSRPFVLVLDDLHAITEPAIHEALDHFIERLPAGAHVAATTRYDPPLALARLRARGQLAELRLPDLRFTTDETGDLLNGQLALDLPAGDVALLHDRTEGWAAGLRLLALMLGRLAAGEERRALIARLGDDGRYIFEFMADEVLHQQEPELQRFLLDVAILPELTPALCRAVTGREDAGQLLDRAFRRNLFLTLTGGPVGETGRAYRFHDLFAAFLRGRLAEESPDHARELHRRAAEAATDASQAIAHYCAAEYWEEAARVIEERGGEFARQGMYRRLHDWIAALPTGMRDNRPRLLLLSGAYAFHTGDWATARPLLERAWHGLSATGDAATALEATMFLINIAARSGDAASLGAWTKRAAEYGPLPAPLRLFLDLGRAWDGVRTNDYAVVEERVAACVDLILASDDPAMWNIAAVAPPLALGPSGTAKLAKLYSGALRRVGSGLSLASAAAESGLAYLHLVRGQFDDAAAAAERASAIGDQLGGIVDLVPGDIQIAFTLALLRDGPEAAEHVIEARWPQIAGNAALRAWLPGFRYLVAKARWLAGRTAAAGEALAGLDAGGPYPEFPLVAHAQHLLAGMLATSAGDHAGAEFHLRAAAAIVPPYYSVLFWLDHPGILLAHAHERAGRPSEALEALRPVLEEYERLDTPGIILKVGPIVAPLLRLAAERQVHAAFAERLLALLGSAPGDIGRS